jgi:nitrate/TMAO reductase-like tetraheme cytochrome c subunit
MTYREKTLHWAGPAPWNPGGSRLRFKQPKRAFTAMTENKDGNVTYIPLLVGRPCYGIITAFLRYKDEMKPVKGRGLLPASRCSRCILRDSCQRLVKERIKASPAVKAAHEEWLKAEGPTKFKERDFEHTLAGRLWKRLTVAAADAGFTSCNDAAVIEHYQRQDQQALADDRRRQAAKRERARKAGNVDAAHLADLKNAADDRLLNLTIARIAPIPPREFRGMPSESFIDLRNVWLGREVLRAQCKKCRAPDIARWIQVNGLRDASSTFAALSTRVTKDLQRLEKFERVVWNGAPLLKPFDPLVEYSTLPAVTP